MYLQNMYVRMACVQEKKNKISTDGLLSLWLSRFDSLTY